jgi:hypothetical protein
MLPHSRSLAADRLKAVLLQVCVSASVGVERAVVTEGLDDLACIGIILSVRKGDTHTPGILQKSVQSIENKRPAVEKRATREFKSAQQIGGKEDRGG